MQARQSDTYDVWSNQYDTFSPLLEVKKLNFVLKMEIELK